MKAGEIPAADIAAVTSSVVGSVSSVDVCTAYCQMICEVCYDSNANRIACGMSVVAPVLGMMKAHLLVADLQQAACNALRNLVFENYDNQVKTVLSGGLKQVYAAMKAHAASAAVQEVACGALMNLAVTEDSVVRIVSSGGLELVYAALDGHSASVAVQKAACRALGNLAVHADNKVKIVSSGGLVRLYAAMEDHAASDPLQEQACRALWNLSQNAENAEQMRAEGRAEALLRQAKSTHPHVADVQKYADKALSNVAQMWFDKIVSTLRLA